MSNWYDNISDEDIQAMKNNKVQIDLLELESEQLANLLRQLPREGELQVFLGIEAGWTSASKGAVIYNLTYRLNPNWERPEEEMVECASWSNKTSPGCYIIKKLGHKFFLTEHEAQTVADQINNHIMESEMAADAYKEAEEQPF